MVAKRRASIGVVLLPRRKGLWLLAYWAPLLSKIPRVVRETKTDSSELSPKSQKHWLRPYGVRLTPGSEHTPPAQGVKRRSFGPMPGVADKASEYRLGRLRDADEVSKLATAFPVGR